MNPFADIYGAARIHMARWMNWQLSEVCDDLREMRRTTMLEF